MPLGGTNYCCFHLQIFLSKPSQLRLDWANDCCIILYFFFNNLFSLKCLYLLWKDWYFTILPLGGTNYCCFHLQIFLSKPSQLILDWANDCCIILYFFKLFVFSQMSVHIMKGLIFYNIATRWHWWLLFCFTNIFFIKAFSSPSDYNNKYIVLESSSLVNIYLQVLAAIRYKLFYWQDFFSPITKKIH